MYALVIISLVSFSGVSAFTEHDVTYYFHSRSSPDGVGIKNDEYLEKDIPFNASLTTLILIHGWLDNHKAEMNQLILKAALEKCDINVIIADWSPMADSLYGIATSHYEFTGNCIAMFLHNFTKTYEVHPDNITIVGHSLGSHIAGVVGKAFNNELSAIVGLEPARPFIDPTKLPTLTKTDAKYVQVVHTSSGKLSFKNPMGNADFYPNGGTDQPGCFLDIFGNCAHKKAYKYYAESIANNQFVAKECNDYSSFKSSKCEGETALMGGYPVNTNIKGLYYLDTNANPPYGKGDN